MRFLESDSTFKVLIPNSLLFCRASRRAKPSAIKGEGTFSAILEKLDVASVCVKTHPKPACPVPAFHAASVPRMVHVSAIGLWSLLLLFCFTLICPFCHSLALRIALDRDSPASSLRFEQYRPKV